MLYVIKLQFYYTVNNRNTSSYPSVDELRTSIQRHVYHLSTNYHPINNTVDSMPLCIHYLHRINTRDSTLLYMVDIANAFNSREDLGLSSSGKRYSIHENTK